MKMKLFNYCIYVLFVLLGSNNLSAEIEKNILISFYEKASFSRIGQYNLRASAYLDESNVIQSNMFFTIGVGGPPPTLCPLPSSMNTFRFILDMAKFAPNIDGTYKFAIDDKINRDLSINGYFTKGQLLQILLLLQEDARRPNLPYRLENPGVFYSEVHNKLSGKEYRQMKLSCHGTEIIISDGLIFFDSRFVKTGESAIHTINLLLNKLFIYLPQQESGAVVVNLGHKDFEENSLYTETSLNLHIEFVWNYILNIIKVLSVDSNANAELRKANLPLNIAIDVKIPSNFPEQFNTANKAKEHALRAFAARYQSVEALAKNESLKSISKPEQFVCKVLKLKDTVAHFAPAGTEIWQVEMFSADNELICAAWINPHNNSVEPQLFAAPAIAANTATSTNAATLANAAQTIFILEPIQAIHEESNPQ